MKRLGLAAFGLFLGFGSMSAQNAYDALNISREDPVMGTARYSAMAGAFGALGANASTMKDNPAGLGVYSKWDLTFTPNVYVTNDNSLGCSVNNFGLIINFGNSGKRNGYVTSSFGIGYSRLKNFKSYSSVVMRNQDASMTDDMYAYATHAVYSEAVRLELLNEQFDGNGKLVGASSTYSPDDKINRRVRFKESGGIGEWDFSYGMNISNRFYWGVGLGVTSLDYTQKANYDETSPSDGSWYLDNYYEATGSGFNFKLGAIARVTDFFRVGLAFHTPTFWTIDQYTDQNMDFDDVNASTHQGTEISASDLTYDLQTPLKLQASLGFVLGKRAIIGLEYQFADYSAMRLTDCDGDVFGYENGHWTARYADFDETAEKDNINEAMKMTHTIKVGAEVNITKGFAGRLGAAYVTKPVKDEAAQELWYSSDYPVSLPKETLYLTGGLGYRGECFYADMALVYKRQANMLYDYLPADKAISDDGNNNMNIMATIGWKF